MIADWLIRLTTAQRNWGFGVCFAYLRHIKGFTWNHKRVYRIIRLFNVVDDFNREGVGIEVDFSLPAERVTRALNL